MSEKGHFQHKPNCPVMFFHDGICDCEPRTEMTSLVEIKRRLATIEQGQGVLLERLDAILKRQDQILGEIDDYSKLVMDLIEAIEIKLAPLASQLEDIHVTLCQPKPAKKKGKKKAA